MGWVVPGAMLFQDVRQVTVRCVEPGAMLLQDVRQVAERWVVPSAMFLQDVWLEPPLERGFVSWKRALVISPG